MALFPLQGLLPAGQFDIVDTELAGILGGEVLTLTSASRTNTATEKSAFDSGDGYLFDATVPVNNRPVLTKASTVAQFPLFLADDGLAGYGTLFGQVIGGVGLTTTGTNAGPHTAFGSGKVSAWGQGNYAVSTDALVSDFITSASTGASGGLAPGQAIGFSAATGKLAHTACSSKLTDSGVANFIEFESTPGLVNTPLRLIGATQLFTRIVISFHAGTSVRTMA